MGNVYTASIGRYIKSEKVFALESLAHRRNQIEFVFTIC